MINVTASSGRSFLIKYTLLIAAEQHLEEGFTNDQFNSYMLQKNPQMFMFYNW